MNIVGNVEYVAPKPTVGNHYGKRDFIRNRKGLRPSRGRFFHANGSSWLPIWEISNNAYYYDVKFNRHVRDNREPILASKYDYPKQLHCGLLGRLINREMERRKNSAYAGFVTQLINDPANRGTHYRALADWLEEQGRSMESRKVMQFVKEVGL